MALVNVTLTYDADFFHVTIGQETFDVFKPALIEKVNSQSIDGVLAQIAARLAALDVDLSNDEAIKTAVESGGYQY